MRLLPSLLSLHQEEKVVELQLLVLSSSLQELELVVMGMGYHRYRHRWCVDTLCF